VEEALHKRALWGLPRALRKWEVIEVSSNRSKCDVMRGRNPSAPLGQTREMRRRRQAGSTGRDEFVCMCIYGGMLGVAHRLLRARGFMSLRSCWICPVCCTLPLRLSARHLEGVHPSVLTFQMIGREGDGRGGYPAPCRSPVPRLAIGLLGCHEHCGAFGGVRRSWDDSWKTC
jgi:hypothetical protein